MIGIADEPHHHLVIDNEWVRAYSVEIGVGDSTLCHLHALPYLMYVAGEAQILNCPRSGDAKEDHFSPDFCNLSAAGLEHIVENLGNSPFRNLIFELPAATEKLRRPGLGFVQVAGVRTSVLHSGHCICAQLMTLSSGSQVQVTGAAVVCSPYEEAVEFISPELGTRKLEDFRQLEFLPSGSTALLRCEAGGPARSLVVTLGCE